MTLVQGRFLKYILSSSPRQAPNVLQIDCMRCRTASRQLVFFALLQNYLIDFNQMIEDIKGKGVGFFAVCAEPQAPVDKMMKDHDLGFTVRFGVQII